jgi:type I restriction-modification system DNA methylase subunit
VVQQYYDALKTKDDAKLKETLTTAFVDRIQESMKDDNFKGSLAAFVAQDEYREGSNIEVRNEKINGNRASAELRGGAYKNWTTFDFALESGKWRFTGGSPDIDSMPASNVNAAR